MNELVESLRAKPVDRSFEQDGMRVDLRYGTDGALPSVFISIPWNFFLLGEVVNHNALVIAVAERAIALAELQMPPGAVMHVYEWPTYKPLVEWAVTWEREKVAADRGRDDG